MKASQLSVIGGFSILITLPRCLSILCSLLAAILPVSLAAPLRRFDDDAIRQSTPRFRAPPSNPTSVSSWNLEHESFDAFALLLSS